MLASTTVKLAVHARPKAALRRGIPDWSNPLSPSEGVWVRSDAAPQT